MTEQTIPDVTDEERRLARKWAEDIVTGLSNARMRAAARVILEAVPAPAPPTLADMTREERDGCRWMQADVRNFDRRMVVTEVHTSSAGLIERDGERWNVDLDRVTPRPDLPRMAWPGDQKSDN